MTKFITGQQALTAIARGANDIQCLRTGEWRNALLCTAIEFLEDRLKFRVTPKLIQIGDMKIEAAETEAPPVGTKYYMPNLANELLHWVSTWQNTVYDLANLKRHVVHLSPENAVAQTKAIILVSGGSLDDLVVIAPDPEPTMASDNAALDMPPPVLEHEDKPATEKKRRTNRKTAAVEPVADLPVEAVPVDTVEPEPETPADFVTPEAVQFDEPQPEDLEPVLSERMVILLEHVKNATTGAQIISLKMGYTHGLTPSEMATLESAMASRTRELMAYTPSEPIPVQQPKLSLAERIKASRSIEELRSFFDEIDGLDPISRDRMADVYDARRKELVSN